MSLLRHKNIHMYINSYLSLTYFYLDVSISIRDLRQKKLVQFLFQFLPW